MTSVREIALNDVANELAKTRRFLELLPDDKLEWKPHARSRSLGRLAVHLAEMVGLQERILSTDGGIDFAAALGSASDATLTAAWTARVGPTVLASGPRAAVLRQMGVSHLVHHRAQLGVYYRLLDIPLPGSYGPTADER